MPSRMIGKWLGFVSALWVQAISGNNYVFANYSVELKAILGINQTQLNGLSSAKDVGKAFGLIAGVLADIYPTWVLLLIGSIEGLVGYGLQWLVISETIQPLPYWPMCVLMCMGGNSTTWMNTSMLVTCLRNFSGNRGPVSGILKAYVGLSPAIFTDFWAALFPNEPSALVLLLAVIPFAICTIAMFLLRPVEPVHESEKAQEGERHFSFLNAVAILLALYLLIYDMFGVEDVVASRFFSGGLVLILALPAGLPLYLQMQLSKKQSRAESTRPLLKAEEEQPKSYDSVEAVNGSRVAADFYDGDQEKFIQDDLMETGKKSGRPLIGDEHTPMQALRTMEFWILFVCFLCGVGTAMAVLNNLGQIAESFGYTSSATFISLTSIFGFFGRLASGELSEYLIRWGAVPRPAVIAASQVAMTVGFAVLASGMTASLYIGTIVMGTCYGVRIAVSIPVASELFGLKPLGLVYNVLVLNLPLGSFLFSSLLAGYFYDREAAKESSTTCIGVHCYRVVFLVIAAVSALGCVLDLVLALRTRTLYGDIRREKRARDGKKTMRR